MEATEPKVSVLTPVFNRPEQITHAVRSALAQTHRNLEVVVSDNASTDDTWAVVQRLAEEDSRVRIRRNASNLGPTRNWIAGLAECTGDYVKVLWSDDWMEPTCVEELLRPMHGQQEVALAFCAALVHRSDRDQVVHYFPERREFTTAEYLHRSLLGNSMPVSPACALVRRTVANFRLEIGDSPRLRTIVERYGAGPDLLMLLDAAAASSRVTHVPKFLTHFCAGRTSITCAYPAEVTEGYRLARDYFITQHTGRPEMGKIKARLAVRRWKQTVKRALTRS